eukprot:163427_1
MNKGKKTKKNKSIRSGGSRIRQLLQQRDERDRTFLANNPPTKRLSKKRRKPRSASASPIKSVSKSSTITRNKSSPPKKMARKMNKHLKYAETLLTDTNNKTNSDKLQNENNSNSLINSFKSNTNHSNNQTDNESNVLINSFESNHSNNKKQPMKFQKRLLSLSPKSSDQDQNDAISLIKQFNPNKNIMIYNSNHNDKCEQNSDENVIDNIPNIATGTDVTTVITPSTLNENQKQSVIKQAAQEEMNKLNQKNRNLKKAAENARKHKQNATTNRNKNDQPLLKQKKKTFNSMKQFDDLGASLQQCMDFKYYIPKQEDDEKFVFYSITDSKVKKVTIKKWDDIRATQEYKKLLQTINGLDVKVRSRSIKQLSNISCLYYLVQTSNKYECIVSSKLLSIALSALPCSIYYQANDEISPNALGGSVRAFFKCQKQKLNYIKKNDKIHHMRIKPMFKDIVKCLLELDTDEEFNKFIEKFDWQSKKGKMIFKEKYKSELLQSELIENLINKFQPFISVYKSKLSPFLKHTIINNEFVLQDHQKEMQIKKSKVKYDVEINTNNRIKNTNNSTISTNNDEEKREESTTNEKSMSTKDIMVFLKVFKQIVNDDTLLSDILQNEECENVTSLLERCFYPTHQIQSMKGLLRSTMYIKDGVAAAAFIAGHNIKSVEKDVNGDRGIISIKCSVVSVVAPPSEWKDFELWKTHAKIIQTFDTISFEGEKGLKEDDVKVLPISDTKIFVGWPFIGNNKIKNTFSFKTPINALQFKKSDIWIKKRRKLLLIKQTDLTHLEYFELSKQIKDDHLLKSLNMRYGSIKKMEKLANKFEELVLPLIVHHDAVKRHIDYDGNLDTNTTWAWSRPKFRELTDWKKAHLLFLLMKFGQSLDLVIPWTPPTSKSETIVFNINDCYPYQIPSLIDSIAAGDILIP